MLWIPERLKLTRLARLKRWKLRIECLESTPANKTFKDKMLDYLDGIKTGLESPNNSERYRPKKKFRKVKVDLWRNGVRGREEATLCIFFGSLISLIIMTIIGVVITPIYQSLFGVEDQYIFQKVFFGGLGAFISIIRRIPGLQITRDSTYLIFLRGFCTSLIGSVAGVILPGIINKSADMPIAAIAFFAGFSERLLDSAASLVNVGPSRSDQLTKSTDGV